MIVNPTQEGWEIIYHRGHALLAAQIASQWRRGKRPPRIIETIAAISDHDDLAREWESDNIGPTGAPLDFTLQTGTDVDSLRALVTGARYRSRWVALLISKHISFLFEPSRDETPELQAFLDEQTELQEQLREGLGIDIAEAEEAYAFMQWCDRMSLILAQRNLPARERALEVSKGPDGVRYDVLQRADGTVTVQPWPFEHNEFTVSVEATYVSQVSFQNNAQFVEVLKTAPIQTLEWRFVK
jgi:hypothetical protein